MCVGVSECVYVCVRPLGTFPPLVCPFCVRLLFTTIRSGAWVWVLPCRGEWCISGTGTAGFATAGDCSLTATAASTEATFFWSRCTAAACTCPRATARSTTARWVGWGGAGRTICMGMKVCVFMCVRVRVCVCVCVFVCVLGSTMEGCVVFIVSPLHLVSLPSRPSPLAVEEQHAPRPGLVHRAGWHHLPRRGTPHASRLTPHPSRLTPRASRLTPHASPLTPHASRLTPHPSRLTPHASRLTPHTSHLTCRARRRFINRPLTCCHCSVGQYHCNMRQGRGCLEDCDGGIFTG